MSRLQPGSVQIPNGWQPWSHQIGVWNAIVNRGVKRACGVWHRRAGKDMVGINMIAVWMMKRPGIYWHVLPTYTQGQKAIWNGMSNDGRKFIDFIPPEIVEKRRNDDMIIKVYDSLGGSMFQVIGGDQPDRIVGGNPIGVVFSEYSLMNPMAWDLIRPILNANDGWAYFNFTPRGYNHGYHLYQNALQSKDWHAELKTIRDTRKPDGTPIVTEDQVEEEIRMGMPAELAQQEFYCDFNAPLTGAYFGKEMDRALKENRIGKIPYHEEYPVNTSWDIGVRDSTAIWFFQVIDGWVNYIDYYASSGTGLKHYLKEMQKKPYLYGKHYGPHDVTHREFSTGRSIADTARQLGFRYEMVPKLSLADGIEAARLAIGRSRFDSEKCKEGIECLRHYRKDFDHRNRVWGAKPVHDWTSHGADAYRTGAIMLPRSVPALPPVAQGDPWRFTFDDAIRKHEEALANRAAPFFRRL